VEELESGLTVSMNDDDFAGQTRLQRRIAVTRLPEGEIIKSDENFHASWLSALTGGIVEQDRQASFATALTELPIAPVRGCAEFVPSLYITPKSIAESVIDIGKKIRQGLLSETTKEQPPLEKYKDSTRRDTFVFTSNTLGSGSVIGVDSQVVAASLVDLGIGGQVADVHLLYNIDAMHQMLTSGMHPAAESDDQMLQLEGCKPIRATGREGHMRLEYAYETLMTTMRFETGIHGYSTWLSCTTADQKVAIVQSNKQAHWVNMSMPFPVYTEGAKAQNVWCPRDQEDGCFEVWSSPNPNEMAT
jgi:hypothetical protein